MAGVGIIATLKIVPGKEKDFEQLFKELRASTLKNEPGVLMYDFYKSRTEPNTYVVMEQYKSQADLDSHGTAEHGKAFAPRFGGIMAAAPTIHLMDRCDQ